MAQLIVRNLPEELVKKLKLRAARSGRSAEAEHREILRSALEPPESGERLRELLARMPPVGVDKDFERPVDHGRDVDL